MTLFSSLSGVAGSLASAMLGGKALSEDASGALWGLFGASAVLDFLPLVKIPAPVLIQPRRSAFLIRTPVRQITFAPDGKLVVVAGIDGPVQDIDVRTGQVRTLLPGFCDRHPWVAVSPNGRLVASAGMGPGVRLLDAVSGRQERLLTG